MNTEKMVLGPLQTNCYIVYDTKSTEAMIIDPAASPETIINKVKELNAVVKYIVLTHAHCDHLCALDILADYYNAKICIGSDETEALNNNAFNLCSYFGTKSPTHKADIKLKDGDVLKLGDEEISVISTPGHTKGGISLLYDKCAITGDTLFAESVGRTDFPGGSSSTLINSIKNKLFVLSDDTVVYPGHGESTNIGHEKNNNPYIW